MKILIATYKTRSDGECTRLRSRTAVAFIFVLAARGRLRVHSRFPSGWPPPRRPLCAALAAHPESESVLVEGMRATCTFGRSVRGRRRRMGGCEVHVSAGGFLYRPAASRRPHRGWAADGRQVGARTPPASENLTSRRLAGRPPSPTAHPTLTLAGIVTRYSTLDSWLCLCVCIVHACAVFAY